MRGLLRAYYWMDESLQNGLVEAGFQPRTRTQTMILINISNGITRAAELARVLAPGGRVAAVMHHADSIFLAPVADEIAGVDRVIDDFRLYGKARNYLRALGEARGRRNSPKVIAKRRTVDEALAAIDAAAREAARPNALAGPENVRIRRRACFSDRDIGQLIQHEAGVHVLTSLNGRAQPDVPLLALSHPGTTRTQEGLAVFAEFITGSMEIDRLRRLVDRVHAVQMALDGADFLDVYRYFLERGAGAEQAFENARRVFRGGRVEGGVPFTKDIVYLDGLFRVHNFMRTVVSLGRADLLRLLFAGKLDLEDIPALAELNAAGLCRPPAFLPPWAADLRFLLSYLAYSSFLNSVDLRATRQHYEDMVRTAPVSPIPAA